MICTFAFQSAAWLESLRTRKRKPVSPVSLRSYESRVRRILSIVGPDTLLESFGNSSLKALVAEVAAKSSDKTTTELVAVIKQIFASATDEEGNELFPRKFNLRFADVPVVDKSKQKTPCFTKEQVEQCIQQATSEQEQVLYALLAGIGLRISEARSILVNSAGPASTTWNGSDATITVRDSMNKDERMDRVKTDASRRTVQLDSRLNKLIGAFAARTNRQPDSYLFQNRKSGPLNEKTARLQLAKRIKGGAFHAFRRFRITHCRSARMLEEILRAEIGHSSSSMTDHYSHVADDVTARRAVVEQAGLGFTLEKVGYPAPSATKKSKPAKVKKPDHARARKPMLARAKEADEARRAALNSPAPAAFVATDEDLPENMFPPNQPGLEELELLRAERDRLCEVMGVKL
jgi:integrase